MKKIMFSDRYKLTQAVLEGRKTMTRRACKYGRPDKTYDIAFPIFGPNDYDDDGKVKSPLNYAFGWRHNNGDFTGWNIPQYKVGEIVAIAQSYRDIVDESAELRDILLDEKGRPRDEFCAGWNNKLFTRTSLLPHHIRITDIRMERLQSITKNDCLKEGVELFETHSTNSGKAYTFPGVNESYITPLEAFAALIDKVSGKGAWDSNPYVFVYEFELVD